MPAASKAAGLLCWICRLKRRNCPGKILQVPKNSQMIKRPCHAPWPVTHDVIDSQGRISLPIDAGFEEQRERLLAEGVEVSDQDQVDLAAYLWDEIRGEGRCGESPVQPVGLSPPNPENLDRFPYPSPSS
jgi:hypothetical protein